MMADEMENSSPEYSFNAPRRQHFSLPYFIIAYLLETQSPLLLLKLQKSCKHFFAQKNVVVIGPTIYLHDSNEFYCSTNGEHFEIVLDNGIQFWLTRICFRTSYSTIVPHIYRVTLIELTISDQNLSLDDIDFLLSNNKMKYLEFYKVEIHDNVGNPVPVDYILGKIPSVIKINYWNTCEIYSNELLEKLNSIQFNQKLTEFCFTMQQTSEVINAEVLGEFVERNLASDGYVSYALPRNARESNRVRTKLNKIVDAWVSSNFKKPRCVVKLL